MERARGALALGILACLFGLAFATAAWGQAAACRRDPELRSGITVTVTSPRDGEAVSGQVVVEGEASGFLVGVERVELWVDGVLRDSAVSTPPRSPFPFRLSWNAQGRRAGAVDLEVVACARPGPTGAPGPWGMARVRVEVVRPGESPSPRPKSSPSPSPTGRLGQESPGRAASPRLPAPTPAVGEALPSPRGGGGERVGGVPVLPLLLGGSALCAGIGAGLLRYSRGGV